MLNAPKPIHPINLDILIDDLVSDAKKVGIEICVPPVESWRRDPATGEEKTPSVAGHDISYHFPNPQLTKTFNLEACRPGLDMYLHDLNQLIFTPGAHCTPVLEEFGPMNIILPMTISLRGNPDIFKKKLTDLLLTSLMRVPKWGCAYEFLQTTGTYFHENDGDEKEFESPDTRKETLTWLNRYLGRRALATRIEPGI